MAAIVPQPLYVFIDESGDFNFSPKGTKYYTITAVITHAPWEKAEDISVLRHRILSGDLVLAGIDDKYLQDCLQHRFHATEDKQSVRDEFFKLINSMKLCRAHTIVVQKNKTNPSIRTPERFYPKILASLLDYILKRYNFSSLCIFLDSLPVNKGKSAFIGAIKSEIKNKQPSKPYRIYYPTSASNLFLQVSDYVNWAVFKKWETSDCRSYDLIKHLLGTPERDIFSAGTIIYY